MPPVLTPSPNLHVGVDREADLGGRFGAFLSGKGRAHRFDFLSAKGTTES
jgi:hypothetical protein